MEALNLSYIMQSNAVACMPLFDSGYDSQKRLIDFPVNPPHLE
jgi:hypothetical protein